MVSLSLKIDHHIMRLVFFLKIYITVGLCMCRVHPIGHLSIRRETVLSTRFAGVSKDKGESEMYCVPHKAKITMNVNAEHQAMNV